MRSRQAAFGVVDAGAIVTGVTTALSTVATTTVQGLSLTQQNRLARQQAEQEAERIRLAREVALLENRSAAAQAGVTAQSDLLNARQQQMALLAGTFVMVAALGVGAIVLSRR